MAALPKNLPDLLGAFQQQLDELAELFSGIGGRVRPGESEHSPRVDCFETADSYVVEMELPGVAREDLDLRIDGRTLLLVGCKREEEKKSMVNFICLERTFGRFCRTVEIPPMVDAGGASARFDKGLLTVTFPKILEARPSIRDIPIE